ncbi:hypothetical protein A2U01_0101937, partial [Trifolium medium]|nr:hypothetical protein [Trifolium medium]
MAYITSISSAWKAVLKPKLAVKQTKKFALLSLNTPVQEAWPGQPRAAP